MMRALTGRHCGWLGALGLLVAVVPAGLAEEPLEWRVLQGLSQSADMIVQATVERVTELNREGDAAVARPATVRIVARASAVYLGDPALEDQPLLITVEGDSPIRYRSTQPRLLFLRETEDGLRLVRWDIYGVFAIKDGFVQAWWEGRGREDRLAVRDVLLKVREYRAARVDLLVVITRAAGRQDDTVEIAFTYRNRGDVPAEILPPSWYQHAIRATRVVGTGGIDGRTPNVSLGNWDFLDGEEASLTLSPRESATFTYPVPLNAIGASERGVYKLRVWLRGARLTPAAETALGERAVADMWLGNFGPLTQRTVVR
jgi:hypothetical protein